VAVVAGGVILAQPQLQKLDITSTATTTRQGGSLIFGTTIHPFQLEFVEEDNLIEDE